MNGPGLFSNIALKIDALNTKQNGKKKYFLLNMMQAHNVYDFYYHKEPFITICRELKFGLIFKGDVSLTWGDGLLHSKGLQEDEEKQDLKTLLEKCLDYKHMFGMCPIKILIDKKTKKKKPFIPEFGTGVFILVLDQKQLQTSVIFLPYLIDNKLIDTSKNILENSLGVFVWPGEEPSLYNGKFKSKMCLLFDEFLAIEELKKNALDADFESTHPTIFTQTKPEKRSLDELTEEEMFADIDSGVLDPLEKRTYRRNTLRALGLENLANSYNKEIRQGFAPLDNKKYSSDIRKRIDPTTYFIEEFHRKRSWQESMEPLPIGEEMATQISLNARTDFLEWKSGYEDTVCLMMGIPRGYILGRGKFKTDAEQEQEIVRNTVISDRTNVEMFYQWVYEILYRNDDNAKLTELLLNIDSKIEEIEKLNNDSVEEELKKLKKTKKILSRISFMPKRVDLMFHEDPFPRAVNIAAVILASDRNTITALEQVNLLRNKLDLEGVDETHQLVLKKLEEIRQNEEAIKIEHAQMKLNLKLDNQPQKRKQNFTQQEKNDTS